MAEMSLMRKIVVGGMADAMSIADDVLDAYFDRRIKDGKADNKEHLWRQIRFSDRVRLASAVIVYTASLAESAAKASRRAPDEIQREFDQALEIFSKEASEDGVALQDTGRVVRLMVGSDAGKRMIWAMHESVAMRG